MSPAIDPYSGIALTAYQEKQTSNARMLSHTSTAVAHSGIEPLFQE